MLNTGTYELVKQSIEHYFFENEQNISCQKIQVYDNTERLVESRYKVALNDNVQARYTLNLYHTSSSALINGKSAELFLHKHFPSILEYIDTTLAKDNINIHSVHKYLRCMLQKCLQGSQHSDNAKDTACITNDSAVMEESTNQTSFKKEGLPSCCECFNFL